MAELLNDTLKAHESQPFEIDIKSLRAEFNEYGCMPIVGRNTNVLEWMMFLYRARMESLIQSPVFVCDMLQYVLDFYFITSSMNIF